MRIARRRCYLSQLLLGLVVCLLKPGGDALAGGVAPCQMPFAFEDAAVNAIILPFFYEAGDANDGASLGEQLSALVQGEVLLSMLKYQSVGAVRLYGTRPNDCDPSRVIGQLTHGNSGRVRSGNGLVLVWGRIYVEGQKILLQTYVRFLRRDVEDVINVALPGQNGAELALQGRLPAEAVATQPRAISRQDLDEVRAAYRRTLVVRQQPEDSAPGTPIDLHPSLPINYAVVKVKGDWMYIDSRGAGPSGWLKGRGDSKGWELRKFMPELGFVDAIIGYERLNAAAAPPLSLQPAYGWISTELAEYEEAVGTNASPLAVAVGRTLKGFLLWTKTPEEGRAPARKQAAELFADAMQILPQYTETRNLAAITQAYRTGGAPTAFSNDAVRQLDADLLGALAVDGHNKTVLGNLERLYAYSLEHPGATPLYPDLTQRLAVVRAVGKNQ